MSHTEYCECGETIYVYFWWDELGYKLRNMIRWPGRKLRSISTRTYFRLRIGKDWRPTVERLRSYQKYCSIMKLYRALEWNEFKDTKGLIPQSLESTLRGPLPEVEYEGFENFISKERIHEGISSDSLLYSDIIGLFHYVPSLRRPLLGTRRQSRRLRRDGKGMQKARRERQLMRRAV